MKQRVGLFLIVSCAAAIRLPLQGAEPLLPAGLGNQPVLPAGLGSSTTALAEREGRSTRGSLFELPDNLDGFWETRVGARTQRDRHAKRASIGETRLQLDFEESGEWCGVRLVSDLIYDRVADDHAVSLYRGTGWVDLRQASIFLRPTSFLDLSVGRQINTWGNGDMLFINDLFPKDWNSYFLGRDDEYLKAPSDSLKASFFSEVINLDIIYSPRFNSDRYIDGRRVSYWNAELGSRAGDDAPVAVVPRNDCFDDDEWAARLFRNIGTYEVALYGYDGFWKSPGGSDPARGRATFPRLQSYGASARGPLGAGILSLEGGWYRSRDDRHGSNPLINNSETRWLIGYEQELLRELTGGVQYYVEQMLDYSEYRETLPQGMAARDEWRHVVTLRLTKLLLQQNLTLGLFLYWSPSDHDAYLRPKINYKLDDHWIVEAGGNLFIGSRPHTFFGQFERNNNLYASLRYGF